MCDNEELTPAVRIAQLEGECDRLQQALHRANALIGESADEKTELQRKYDNLVKQLSDGPCLATVRYMPDCKCISCVARAVTSHERDPMQYAGGDCPKLDPCPTCGNPKGDGRCLACGKE
jgi:hypothetical protein